MVRLPRARLLLTHGHYFDPSQSFYQEIAKAFADPVPKNEIPKLRKAFFRRASAYQNIVSGLSIQPRLRTLFNSVYQPISSLKHSLHHRNRKAFVTPAMRRNIECYTTFCCRGKVEGVIFGHTHRAGKASFHDGPIRHIWNSGTFLRESKDSPAGSFLTLQLNGRCNIEEAVQVHLL